MNVRLSPKIIKERCGIVSFKRGEAFFRSNKVSFEKISSQCCEALVKGTEDFHVVLQKDGKELKANCSCPSLVSYQKDCQHIAAVLLAIYDKQKRGTTTPVLYDVVEVPSDGITENLLKLFNAEKRSSTHRGISR